MALEQQNAAAKYRAREGAAPSLEQSTQALLKVGGFDLLETTIDGASNLNPEKKARKKIFLSEDNKKIDRQQLKKRLALWHSLLSEADTVADAVDETGADASVIYVPPPYAADAILEAADA